MLFQRFPYFRQEEDIFIGYFLFCLLFFGQVDFYVFIFAVGAGFLDQLPFLFLDLLG